MQVTSQHYLLREKMNEKNNYRYKNQKKLRCGITTGTCCAVAAKAAAMHLFRGIVSSEVRLLTPKGETVTVPVHSVKDENGISYGVFKDSGDDPDVTNGAEIIATVSLEKIAQGTSFTYENENLCIYLDGGCGIGRITESGMEQEIGQAAINVVPRKMIFEAVEDVANQVGYEGIIQVTVSIPKGEELAKKTFNASLGIVGGLSILGTSGILEPMSEQAIIDTIETQIRKLHNVGKTKMLITPGNYGQSYASDFLKLDLSNSIKCSNYIGETLDLAVSYEMKEILLVGNIGKLIKLAAGIMNTHSKTADARCEIMAVHAGLCGASKEQMQMLMECINTDQMLKLLDDWNLKDEVIKNIIDKIEFYIRRRLGEDTKFGVILFSEKYGFLGYTKDCQKLLESW